VFSLLRVILFSRSYLPAAVWGRVWSAYWRKFWRAERVIEQRVAPNAPEEPIDGSERAVLTEEIVRSYPFENLLEVGCSFGQNFFTLASLFPQVNFFGIDIDAERIAHGQSMLSAEGVENVDLRVASVLDLSEYASDSIDVVTSCALFLYLDPSEAERALLEMLRVARGPVLLMEQHRAADELESLFVKREGRADGYWLHDYEKLGRGLSSELHVSAQKIPAPRWPAEQWKNYAHLIEITL